MVFSAFLLHETRSTHSLDFCITPISINIKVTGAFQAALPHQNTDIFQQPQRNYYTNSVPCRDGK